jgi:hypothetical protein
MIFASVRLPKIIQNHGHVNKKNVNHGTLGYSPCLDKLTWGFPSAMWGVPNVKPQVKTKDNAVVHVCSINSAHTQYHKIYFIFNPYSVPQLFWRHVFVAFDTCHCSSFSVILTFLVGSLSTISARIIYVIGLRIKRKTCVFFPASMTNSSKLSFWLSHPSTDSVTGAFFFHHFLSVHQN